MESVKYILGIPDFIEGVGDVYPVKVKNYDLFIANKNPIMISKDHFIIDGEKDYPLLDLIIYLQDKNIIKMLEELFCLVLKKEVFFAVSGNNYGFVVDEKNIINASNYENIRNIIMQQNLIFEPKVFKDPLVQQWADKVVEARRKNALRYTIEDMISTVKNFNGITYEEIADQTIYQLHVDFNRILKFKNYDTDVLFKTVDTKGNVKIKHFAEDLNIFKNPYDTLFVDKGKLKKLDKAIGG